MKLNKITYQMTTNGEGWSLRKCVSRVSYLGGGSDYRKIVGSTIEQNLQCQRKINKNEKLSRLSTYYEHISIPFWSLYFYVKIPYL